MSKTVRFALALHNHQPIGNFDHVFEQAYQDSYLPFLEVFSRFESLRLSLHTSGSLIVWLQQHHPEYLDRIAELVHQDRIEILGGAFYEPILSNIPSHDRIGQIRRYTRWLEDRFDTTVRGMWIPERVWETTFTTDIVDAGIQYTVIDDFHFKSSGLDESQLNGYYVTEDEGRVLSVFPGSERLRYLIPFADPDQTVEYLRHIAETCDNPVAVFGDDGEKFGTWPETHRHVYTNGWLERFFQAISDNAEWIRAGTLSDIFDEVAPVGKTYIPDGSYREMTEWALPVERQNELQEIKHDMEGDPRWGTVRRFIRGGFWRNFRIRYPESNEMYARMMELSRRLQQTGVHGDRVEQARDELYQAQCNCGYWHGAFGGIYLPHLRNAIYEHLIKADNLLDEVDGKKDPWVEAKARDFDFDGRREIELSNDKLVAMIAPCRGGTVYELDVRSIAHNLGATLTRRPEAYHAKVLQGQKDQGDDVASIHDRVVFKQEGLDKMVQYDDHQRKSLVDLFYPVDASLEAVASGQALQCGDFVGGEYEAKIRRNPDRIQVQMSRDGNVNGTPIRITKGITLESGSRAVEIAYYLENLPREQVLHLVTEFNFAGLPSGADDRYFHDLEGNRLGHLGSRLDLQNVSRLGLVDEWLGIDVKLNLSRSTGLWAFPIETVSQSEGGFELVHQSVAVMPHWFVEADDQGCWGATLRLELDTTRAEERRQEAVTANAT